MKLITAVLPVAGFEHVHRALRTLGIPGMTVCPVFADGHAPRYEVYRGVRRRIDLQPAVRLDILAADEDAADVVRVITVAGQSSRLSGDGSSGAVWVVPVETVVRIRTHERGEAAL